MQIPQNCLAKKIKEQLFFWQGDNIENLVEKLETLESFLAANDGAELSEIAYSLYSETPKNKSASYNLVIVAESLEDLQSKIASSKISLKGNPKFIRESNGIYFSSFPLAKNGKIAFLFSGQGSQRPNMLRDLRGIFTEMEDSIQKADLMLKNRLPKPLSEYIYPPSASTPEQEKQQMEELTVTNITQPALGTVEVGLFKVMKLFGVNPDMLAGHSLGEYVALYAAGVFDEGTLYELLEYRGSAIINSSKCGLGTMLAVGAGAVEVKDILKDLLDVYPVRNSPDVTSGRITSDGVYIANLNSSRQTILSGSKEGLDLASTKLKEKRLMSKKINVSCAFHSPYMIPAKDLLLKKLSTLDYKSPGVPVYSNLTATQYPKDKKSILSVLSEHLVYTVRFTQEIENMFNDGARVFVEIGPGNVLTNLVKQILGEKGYIAVASNIKTASDTSQILNVLAKIMAEGFDVDLSSLYSNS